MPTVTGFEFRVLGPLDVRLRGQPVPVRGAREHAVLAALLLTADRVVPLGKLVRAVWDDDPPPVAEKAVRNSVSALRRRFIQAGGAALIDTEAGGYRLVSVGVYLDAAEFEKRVADARDLATVGKSRDAAEHLRAALRLWRGPVLAGRRAPALQAAAARLEEQRLIALEDCLDLELGLGQHGRSVAELRELTAEWPLRERLTAQLMLALYRSGRQTEALDAYHRLAHKLDSELGIDPSTKIRRLHEAILRHDPALELASPPAGGVAAGALELAAMTGNAAVVTEPSQAGAMVPESGQAPNPAEASIPPARNPETLESAGALPPRPAQLPLEVPGFAGRTAELSALQALLPTGSPGSAQDAESGLANRPGGATVVISAIGGTAGVGKTALAVRFGHQVARHFPDGQLYADLRGFSPSGSPADPADVLRRFLYALGVAADAVPPDMDVLAASYRSLLAGRRMLVVLDNVLDASQARPLLPGNPECLVLITSRRQLTGLAAAHGAHLLTLDVPSWDEARDLLAKRLGDERLISDPDAASELIRLCARLPLALAIAAARAAARPGLSLRDLVAELGQATSPLDVLNTGDPATELRGVLSWSLRGLPGGAARMFALLGLHPGDELDVYAAAALADVSLEEAFRCLDALGDAHLTRPAPQGRYRMHDLLHAYAADLARTDSEAEVAQERLLDYYLATAAAAVDILHPAETHRRPQIRSCATPAPLLPDRRAALAWLNTERPNLVAVTAHAASHGWPSHALRLAATLNRYLQGGYYADAVVIHGHATDAAKRAGDQSGEADALRLLGGANLGMGRYAAAADCLRQALDVYRRIGDRFGEARTLDNLGAAEWHLGRHSNAIEHQERALALFRQSTDVVGQAITLINLGDKLQRLGRHKEAAERLREALALSRQDGDRDSEAFALINLGELEQRIGRLDHAASRFRQSLTIFRALGNRYGEAWALTHLGTIRASSREHEQAARYHRHALDLFRQAGDRNGEAAALSGLGEAVLAGGTPKDAVTHHTAALALAADAGNHEEQARAHAGLSQAYNAMGQFSAARKHFQDARRIYAGLGFPEAKQLRAQGVGLPEERPARRPTAGR